MIGMLSFLIVSVTMCLDKMLPKKYTSVKFKSINIFRKVKHIFNNFKPEHKS